MLHPFRRQIEQLKPPLTEILDHAALFKPGEAGVKRRRRDLSLLQAGHLILHERDERRDDDGGAGENDGRKLITERFSTASRRDEKDLSRVGEDGVDRFALPRVKGLELESFSEDARQIQLGDIRRGEQGSEAR